jgi:polyisoprenoid-binding protein YceI
MFSRRQKFIGGVLAALGVFAATAAVVWYTVLPHDAPSRVNLDDAVASIESGAAQAAPDVASQSGDADSLVGTWVLSSSGESFVGYRVREELATVGAFTAVGRSSNLTAAMEFDGDAITDVQVQADLTSLASDNTMRDRALSQQALETAKFPGATFDLTQPIALANVPAEGEQVSATAVGNLTLHGVTRSISIPLQGQIWNGLVVVVGSIDIRFADFGIAQPSSKVVLSIEDHGVLELQLVFQREGQS